MVLVVDFVKRCVNVVDRVLRVVGVDVDVTLVEVVTTTDRDRVLLTVGEGVILSDTSGVVVPEPDNQLN